jgi:hypothetical protein
LVKLLDFEISAPKLILRLLLALTLSVVTFAALYYAPQLLNNYAKTIPEPAIQNLINQLISPLTPYLGILTTILVFLTITLRKTRIEGPSLIFLGLSLLVYWNVLFCSGNINIQIPVTEIPWTMGINVPLNITAQLTINTITFMLALIITPMLLIIKGALLTATRTLKTQTTLKP